MQSIIAPVISTSLYFVVFGAAIGSRIKEVDGISYGAFIVPGLIMLSLLYAEHLERVVRHLLSALHRHHLRVVVGADVVSRDRRGLCGRGAPTKSILLGLIILTARACSFRCKIAASVLDDRCSSC